jgi:hypothetical protein
LFQDIGIVVERGSREEGAGGWWMVVLVWKEAVGRRWMSVFMSRLRTAGGNVSYAFACAQSHACSNSVTRHEAAASQQMLLPSLHMNEPVNEAVFLSNERDAAAFLSK